MKIFVTGCAGLLGANYTRHLLNNGHEVIGIDDLSGGYKAFIAEGEKFKFIKLNLERRKKSLSCLRSINQRFFFTLLLMLQKVYLHLFVTLTIEIILFVLPI